MLSDGVWSSFFFCFEGLTALKSDEICDLMHRDYPEMYQVGLHQELIPSM